MSDSGAAAPLATLAAPADDQEPTIRPLLDAFRRALTTSAGRPFAKELTTRRIRKDLATLREAPLGAERQAVEELQSDLQAPWKTTVVGLATILVGAQVIIAVIASVAGTEHLLEQSAQVDLTSPFSILELVRVALESSLTAVVFFAWTLLASASLVLAPVLVGARRYRATFRAVALDLERRTWRRLGLPIPAEPRADLLIIAVPVVMLLFLGLHLFLMASWWPVNDHRDGARVALGTVVCAAFAVSATWLAWSWLRRRAPRTVP
jgi:hypothetical protein